MRKKICEGNQAQDIAFFRLSPRCRVLYIAEPCYTVANEFIHSLTGIDSQKSLLALQGRPKGSNSWCVCSMVNSRAWS